MIVGEADGRAVEPKVVVEDDRRGEEGVVEASEPEGHACTAQLAGPHHGGRRTDREHARVRSAAPEVVADVSAVQPNGVFAELAALALVGQAEGLVGRDRGVVVAGGDTHAGAEVVTQLDTRAEAHEHAVTAAVLVGVPLRGKLGAVDLERRSGVDRIEIRKGPGVIVALGIQVRLVAEADLAFRLEAGQKRREARRRFLFAAAKPKAEFAPDVLRELRAHRGRNVGHAHVLLHFAPGGIDRARARLLREGLVGHGLHRGDLGDGEHVGFVLHFLRFGLRLGLCDHGPGVVGREHAALNEFGDQVDHDVSGRCGGRVRAGGDIRRGGRSARFGGGISSRRRGQRRSVCIGIGCHRPVGLSGFGGRRRVNFHGSHLRGGFLQNFGCSRCLGRRNGSGFFPGSIRRGGLVS